MLYSSEFPTLEKGAKNTGEKSFSAALKDKSRKTPGLTKEGKSNDIPHFSFILVFTVGN